MYFYNMFSRVTIYSAAQRNSSATYDQRYTVELTETSRETNSRNTMNCDCRYRVTDGTLNLNLPSCDGTFYNQ